MRRARTTPRAVEALGPDEPATAGPREQDPARGLTRRTLLTRTGLGAAGLATIGLGHRAWDQGVLTPRSGPAYAPWAGFAASTGGERLVAAAVLAASAHNMQPWRFELGPDHLDVHDDRTRSLGVVDPDRREAHLSLGCATTNIEVAAPSAGYATEVLTYPQGPGSSLAVRVRLSPAEVDDSDPLLAAIPVRHSDRGPFPVGAPGADLLADVARRATTGLAGVRLVWHTSRAALTQVGELLVDAADAVVADDAMSRDGFAWLRQSQDDVQRLRDGLTLDAQALTPALTLAAQLLPPTPRRRGDDAWVRATRTTHTATARAYGMVVVDEVTPVSHVAAGRALQRLHLDLTARGWAMQHLNQAIEVAEREVALGGPGPFADRVAMHGAPGTVVAMVRLGRPSGRAVASPRRPVSDVLELLAG